MADWAADDGLPLGYESEDEDTSNAVHAARAARIEAARQQARAYSAKIDSPNWFLNPSAALSDKGASRPSLYVLHQHYLRREYAPALAGAVAAWRALDRLDGADEVELVDIVIRCSLKLGDPIPDEAVEGARRWPVLGRSHPSFCLAASLLLSRLPPSHLFSPLEPLHPLLVALAVQPSLPPYLAQLHALMTRHGFTALAASADGPLERSDSSKAERDAELARLGAAGDGLERVGEVFEKVWRRAAGAEEEEGVGRDVRSL